MIRYDTLYGDLQAGSFTIFQLNIEKKKERKPAQNITTQSLEKQRRGWIGEEVPKHCTGY